MSASSRCGSRGAREYSGRTRRRTGYSCGAVGPQCHLRRGRQQLPRTAEAGTQAELIKMDNFPPHRDLDCAMQLAQGASARHQHTAPYHRADPEQPDLNLHNLAPVGFGSRRGSFNDRAGRLRRSRHFTTLCSIEPPRRGHPADSNALLACWASSCYNESATVFNASGD